MGTRVLTPDTGLGELFAAVFELVGGAMAVALVSAVVAVVAGAVAWSLGHATDSPGLSRTGRLMVVGGVAVAVVAPILPDWVGWLIGLLA